MTAAPLLGQTHLEIRTKEQCKKVHGNRRLTLRKARTASLEIRACALELKPPRRAEGQLALSPIKLWVVMAKEMSDRGGKSEFRSPTKNRSNGSC